MNSLSQSLTVLSLSFLSLAANAGDIHTKIECTYPTKSGAVSQLVLQGPQDVDLKSVGSLIETVKIPLQINGGEPVDFTVEKHSSRVNNHLVFSYQNPFFISDIQITYLETATTFFFGTWTVDYPPEIKLTCKFAK